MRSAEEMLQDLTLYNKPLDIPGNFRAKQRRSKHDNSKLVFPRARKKESDTYRTHYNHQFRTKPNARPSSPRPCSPTRRNNPHPSKDFLNWRIPTRVFDYGKVKTANISMFKSNVNDSHQRFYDDYAGKIDYSHQVDPRQLMDIAKSYAAALQKERKKAQKQALPGLDTDMKSGKVTLGLVSPPNSPVGLKLPNVARRTWTPERSSPNKSPTKGKSGKQRIKSTSPSTKPKFSSWYDIEGLSQSVGQNPDGEEVDENKIEAALAGLKPEALMAIEQWLLSASDEERQIAMKFIEAIILASMEDSKILNASNNRADSPLHGLNPSQFLTGYSGLQNGSAGAHHHNHSTRKSCEVCKKKELESALQQLQMIASLPMEVPAITELLNPLHPSVVKEREAAVAPLPEKRMRKKTKALNRPRQETKFIPNKGSIFVNSKLPKRRHFTIHPEWN